MTQVMERRRRLSWESRCEIVALIEAGMSPFLAVLAEVSAAPITRHARVGCRRGLLRHQRILFISRRKPVCAFVSQPP
jgi:hypothetical protein